MNSLHGGCDFLVNSANPLSRFLPSLPPVSCHCYDFICTSQGMAYASIAGLPPVYGLYSAFMGVLVYFFTGTSKDITLGPTALMSLIVAESFTELPHLYNETYVGVDVDVDLLRAVHAPPHRMLILIQLRMPCNYIITPPGAKTLCIMYFVFCIYVPRLSLNVISTATKTIFLLFCF